MSTAMSDAVLTGLWLTALFTVSALGGYLGSRAGERANRRKRESPDRDGTEMYGRKAGPRPLPPRGTAA